ncbi:MAG: murein biosynthesis integral membrane protein MurJ [Actinobacteria bacterium]|nr:murein biosynthesis integral membrane protein MurJ [Actinomycetota bacterium]
MTAREGSSGASLARGAATITVATAVSRITGFVRVMVVAAVMGTTFLANTYQTANTAPNVVFELVAAGVLTSIFVPTFVDYLVRGRPEEGWAAANALTSIALVALLGLALLLFLGAPGIMRLLTVGVADEGLRAQEISLGAAFLRLFSPQIVLYGMGMIMTGALHAHRRFGMPAVAPIANNVVVIAVYLTYALMRAGRPAGLETITTAETFVLGAGTTLGVVAMTLLLLPELRRIGWRFKFRFDPAHPAVRRGARLGIWALGYAGGYQAGLVVVLLLANGVQGGVAAYQWAYTFFYLPHALFAVPIFHVLFTAMSEHVAKKEEGAYLTRLQDGLAMLFFILIPTAALLFVAAGPLARVTLEYGVMTVSGAGLVARVLAAFAIGLPAYSAFLVLTRAYYALGDARTPAVVNAITVVISSALGSALFYLLGDHWAVPGLAVGHSAAFLAGAAILTHTLSGRAGRVFGAGLKSSVARSLIVGGAALVAMVAVHGLLPETSKVQALANLAATGVIGAVVYLGAMARLHSVELGRAVALVRRS